MDDLEGLSVYLVTNFSETLSRQAISEQFDIFVSIAAFPYKGKVVTRLMFTFNGKKQFLFIVIYSTLIMESYR